MSKTKIWCYTKNNSVLKQKVWRCTKIILVSIKTIHINKKSRFFSKKYFMSTKIRWCCIKKIFCVQKRDFFFPNGAPYINLDKNVSYLKTQYQETNSCYETCLLLVLCTAICSHSILPKNEQLQWHFQRVSNTNSKMFSLFLRVLTKNSYSEFVIEEQNNLNKCRVTKDLISMSASDNIV